MEEKPSYYAIIPANVRYDSELKANEKLLYGEISSLCNKDGTCWASNRYFSNLYGVDISTISRWVNNLISKNYLTVMYGKDNQRILSIDNSTLLIKKSIPIDEKINTPIDEKVKHNNININNKNNILDYYQEKIGILSPLQQEMLYGLSDKIGEDRCKDAIDTALANGVNNFNYIIKVANNRINKKKEIKTPDWLSKECESEEMSSEELAELQKGMDEVFK